jgi:hypothetical protein
VAKQQLPEQVTRTIDAFLDGFVVKTKRERARKLLLGTSEQRIAALQKLPEWLEPALQTELKGKSASPQQLEARFGKLEGHLIDHSGVCRVTIDEAQGVADGGFGALFISDNGKVGLQIPEVGAPTLTVRS